MSARFSAALLLLAPFLLAPEAAPRIRRAPASAEALATLEEGNRIVLEVSARAGDSWVSLAVRYCGGEGSWHRIEAANPGRSIVPGRFYSIPFEALSGDERSRALMALFAGDSASEAGWVHRVPESDAGQSLQTIAAWFAGDPAMAAALAESNGLDPMAPLVPGDEVEIPEELLARDLDLRDDLRGPDPIQTALAPVPALEAPSSGQPVQAAPVAPPAPPPSAKEAGPVREGDLTFVNENGAAMALYRLKPGEALYSAVVARFTGRLDPEEVNAIAKRIAEGSGIARINSIPAGYTIRIPRELILPEYLPRTDPSRVATDAAAAAADRHRLTVRARDLEGVAILLDAGHGGDDIGAHRNGVHEDDYVYDVMCRLKALAESQTAAKVMTTIRDESSGYRPLAGPFRHDTDEVILTSPPFEPRKPHVATVGVNLRWYLVNDRFRSLVRDGYDPQRIVFLSLHADSLHPDVRGAMIYVPGQAYRARSYGHSGRLYDREEVEAARYVRFSASERERSEGLSRQLARRVVESFRHAGLGVHRDKPIRDHVIRRKRAWVPAVIRTSLVPQSLMVEVVNLNNKQDALLLKDPAFRQEVAEALLQALRRHYAGAPADAPSITRARSRD